MSKATKEKKPEIDIEKELAQLNTLQIFKLAAVTAMEDRISKVQLEYQEQLTDYSTKIDATAKRIRAWLKKHKDDFKGPPRSMVFESGTIGYRLGQKHLEPADGYTWEEVKELMSDADQFLRTTVEVKKDFLLAKIEANELSEDTLRSFGLVIAQDDRAYIETEAQQRIAAMAKKD